MEFLSFLLIFFFTIIASIMLHLRDHRLYSIRRNPLAIFVPLLLQSMTLVAIYRALNFYRFENTIIYYMPEWAVVLFYLFSFLLGHALQKIFLVSERSIYSLFSLGSCFTLLCGWLLGSSMLQALNYTIVLVSFSFVQSFKQFETDNFDMVISSNVALKSYVILQTVILSLVSFYFIAALPFMDSFEYLVYFSLLYLNLFQSRSLLSNNRFQPIELARLLLIFLIESDYMQYLPTQNKLWWYDLVQFYVFGSIFIYLFAHVSYLKFQLLTVIERNFYKLTKRT